MMTAADVREAADVLRGGLRRQERPATAGSPSRSTRGWRTTPRRTVAEAKQLAWLVDRAEHPGSRSRRRSPGLPAIAEVIGRGASASMSR